MVKYEQSSTPGIVEHWQDCGITGYVPVHTGTFWLLLVLVGSNLPTLVTSLVLVGSNLHTPGRGVRYPLLLLVVCGDVHMYEVPLVCTW